MAALKDIRNRIASVKKTQKIVSAMKMVAAAKLARAQHAIESARPYAKKLREVLASVSAGVDPEIHPLLVARDEVRRLDVILFTSDRGLCGAFNSNLIKTADALVRERTAAGISVNLIPVGRRGHDHGKRRKASISRHWVPFAAATPELAAEIGQYVMQRYIAGESDEAVLVYGEFRSALTQRPVVERLLPLATPSADTAVRTYQIEPSPEQFLGQILPRAVEFSVFRACLESQASEHGARMTAMDSATSNTEELIHTLTLDYNKARQAAITAELVEIVSGAEAL